MTDAPVVIVGAGLAGLACATALCERGVPVTILEAGEGVGGRVRTDHVDGFTLDRGFQVALTAYPEMHRQLDMAALDLQAFEPGALVWRNGRGTVVGDPFRRPTTALSTALAPIGSPLDKARIALLRRRLRRVHPALLLAGDDVSTEASLREAGFSQPVQRAYTDSSADLPLLQAALEPVVVNPKQVRVEMFQRVLPAGTPILNWGCEDRAGQRVAS